MKKKFFSVLLALVLVCSFSLVTAVPVAAATEVWVDDDAAPEWYDVTHFATILEGIVAVDPGGTVNVLAGTYIEDVTIGKSVTLISHTGDYRTSGVTLDGQITSSGGANDITIQGFNFVVDDSLAHGLSIWFSHMGNDMRILSNSFTASPPVDPTAVSWPAVGLLPSVAYTGLVLDDNLFTGVRGIFVSALSPAANEVTITNNVIDGDSTNPAWAGISVDKVSGVISGNEISYTYDAGFNIAHSSDLIISNNTVTHAGGAEWGNAGAINLYSDCTNITIAGNTLSDSYDGITIKGGMGALGSGIAVNFNNITGNSNNGVLNSADSGKLDAEYNWWGSAKGPGQDGANDVSGDVDFSPWLLDSVTIAGITMSPMSVADGLSKEITFTVGNAGDSAIKKFEFIVPKDGDTPQYIVSEVVTPAGWIMAYSTDMGSGRVSKVTWTKSDSGIAYGESQEFVFTATTPSDTGDYGWGYNITNVALDSQEGSVVQKVDGDAPDITDVTVDPDPNAAGFINQDSAAISATITDAHLDAASLKVYYSTDAGATWPSEDMSGVGGDEYSATLVGLPEGELRYYIYAADTVDPNVATNPVGAPGEYHSFTVDITAPDAPVFAELTVNMNPPGTVDTVEGAAGAVEGDALVEVWNHATDRDELINLIGSIAAAADGSFAAIGIGDNIYAEVWVTAMDVADNRGSATSVGNDNAAPVITVVTWAVGGVQPVPLALGNVIDVTLDGEPGGTGTFDIGTIATGIAMTEIAGVYTGSYTVQSGDDGEWTVNGHLTDAAGNTSEAPAAAMVSIVTDETPPVIGVPAVEYPVGVFSARVGDTVIISVEVTDPIEPATGVVSVSLDALAIGKGDAEPLTPVDGTDTWTTGELTVGAVGPGIKTLTINATDGAGLPADPVEVAVEVTLRLTGYNIALAEDWNLMSLPLIPNNTAIIPMLASIAEHIDVVWGYDPVNSPDDPWAMYVPGLIEDDLTQMVGGMGYWIYMTGSDTLAISGIEMPEPPTVPPAYDVAEGWNLMGVKDVAQAGILYTEYLISIDGDYSVIWGYVDDYFNIHPIGAAPETTLWPGQGCWLWMKVGGIIVPPQ